MQRGLSPFLKIRDQSGFTLVEIAVVMIIGGLIIGSLASSLVIYQSTQLKKETENRLEIIQEALQQYLDINQKYPCPADVNVAPDTAGFGTEDSGGVCTLAPVPGETISVGGVRIGSIPTRALSIPDEYAADAWGNRFKYAVTEALASPGGFVAGAGAISVVDSGGLSLLNIPNQGHYVVVSHGPSGLGAITLQGVAGAACPGAVTPPPPAPAPAGATYDAENCNDDTRFLRTINFSEQAGTQFFDDFLIFQGESLINPDVIVPPGAVVGFNLTNCPAGWTRFAPLIDRFPKGSAQAEPIADNGALAGSDITLTAADIPNHTHTLPTWQQAGNFDLDGGTNAVGIDENGGVSSSGAITTGSALGHKGDATATTIPNNPLHAVLLYCQKN